MIDNLRRTLSAPAAVAALLLGWTMLPVAPAALWTAFIVLTIAVPTLLAGVRRGPRATQRPA